MTSPATSYETSNEGNDGTPHAVPISVRLTKRGVDLSISMTVLLLTGWLFPLVALAIWIESRGPIFYKQRRARAVRFNAIGKPEFAEFQMVKFRTMRDDAERNIGPVLAAENDPRVTRVGRLLRKTRIDELPQLWNVLRGEMSVVGPRPERPELLSDLMMAIPFFEERTRTEKPGITGLAQVCLGYSGRALDGTAVKALEPELVNPFKLAEAEGALADDMRMKLLFDLAYVVALERFSTFLRTELYVILRTPLVMLRGIGR